MAKRGQKIDELYLDIGLNIAQLQLDFDTAGKTVSDSIARLNSKANNIHLKLDADLAKLDGVGTELDKIKVRYQAINRELDIQRQSPPPPRLPLRRTVHPRDGRLPLP